MKIIDRFKAPTPKFFRILRTIGLGLLSLSGSILAAPLVLPAAMVTVAGYVAVAGGVLSAVSQMTVGEEVPSEPVTNPGQDLAPPHTTSDGA
jgi:hypothetical protein